MFSLDAPVTNFPGIICTADPFTATAPAHNIIVSLQLLLAHPVLPNLRQCDMQILPDSSLERATTQHDFIDDNDPNPDRPAAPARIPAATHP